MAEDTGSHPNFCLTRLGGHRFLWDIFRPWLVQSNWESLRNLVPEELYWKHHYYYCRSSLLLLLLSVLSVSSRWLTWMLLSLLWLPVVPHKAVAEVSKIGTYRRGWLLWIADGRAKPLMDRQVVEVSSLSLFLSLFLWLPTYLPIYLPACLCIYLSTYLPIYLPIYLSIYLSICLSVCLSFYPSIYPSFNQSIYPSIHPPTHLSIYLSTYLTIYLSIFLSIYRSI